MAKKAAEKPVSKNPIKKVETKPIKTITINITLREFETYREISFEQKGSESPMDLIGVLESVKLDIYSRK